MKIQVYQCRFTGKLFHLHEKEKYIKHLKELRLRMSDDREHTRIKKNWTEWLKKEKAKITHIDMIGPWFIENQKKIMKAFNAIHNFSLMDEKWPRDCRIDYLNLKFHAYNPRVSNTHCCPENGVTNWLVTEDKPRGYRGWTGRLDGKTTREKKRMAGYPNSETLTFVGIHTGTGGGGYGDWGYDFSIFVDDWPGLEVQLRQMEEDRIVSRLKGVR